VVLLCAALVLAYTAVEFYPQPFFPHRVDAAGIRLYSTGHIPENAESRLLEVQKVVSRSALYEPGRPLTLFLCDSDQMYAFFTSGGTSAGRSNSLTQCIFFNARRVADGSALLSDTFTRVASHEIVHVLMARRFGPQMYFTTPRWLTEGYCETIARRSGYPETWEPLFRAGTDEGSVAFQYFKYRRMVECLTVGDKMTIEQLVAHPPDQGEVEERARRWLWNTSVIE